MKKRNNKSTKIAIISTVVVTAMVGLTVFSLHSLTEGKKDDELRVASAQAGASTNTSKLLTRMDEGSTFEYVVAEAPAYEEPAVVEYAEPVAEVVKVDVDLQVVDNVIDTEPAAPAEPVTEKIEEAPVVEQAPMVLAFVEPETEAPVVYDEPVYEEPVYEEPVYEEPVYDEPVYVEPEYAEPEYQEPVFDFAIIDEPEYEEPEYIEPVVDEPVYEEPEYMEPVYEEPVYEETEDEFVINDSVIDWDNSSNDEYVEEVDDTWTDDSESDDTWTDDSASEDTWEDDYYYENVSSNVSLGQQIVNYASAWVGVTPYVNAYDRWTDYGYYNSLTDGTDCSGFTHLIYGEFGIYVPTGSDAYQGGVGTMISYDQLLPGDIVVYRYGGHVAIYAGNDMIIHCANEDLGTIYSDMWYSTPTAYVRVVY